MEHIAPLIQTLLWVTLIAGVTWRFHGPIYGLLEALRKRVEAGSNIKAGPFEISELVPQDPESQREKAAEETQEALEAEDLTLPEKERASSTTARYYQAEDLALRAIQADYSVPVKRQVTGGRDEGFDGVFEVGGVRNIVEVKYIAGKGHNQKLKSTVHRLTHTIQQYGWPDSQIILVLVFESREYAQNARAVLGSAFAQNSVPVKVHTFVMSELEARFGVGL